MINIILYRYGTISKPPPRRAPPRHLSRPRVRRGASHARANHQRERPARSHPAQASPVVFPRRWRAFHAGVELPARARRRPPRAPWRRPALPVPRGGRRFRRTRRRHSPAVGANGRWGTRAKRRWSTYLWELTMVKVITGNASQPAVSSD